MNKNRYIQSVLIYASWFMMPVVLAAQDAQSVTIKEAVNTALRNSREVALAQVRYDAAEKTAAVENPGAPAEPAMHHAHRRNVVVFDVAFGHPINLSQWGGLDYEIAFYSYRFAGEDHIQPALIDNVGSRTIVSRYKAFESESEAKQFAKEVLLKMMAEAKSLPFTDVVDALMQAFMLRETNVKDVCVEMARE